MEIAGTRDMGVMSACRCGRGHHFEAMMSGVMAGVSWMAVMAEVGVSVRDRMAGRVRMAGTDRCAVAVVRWVGVMRGVVKHKASDSPRVSELFNATWIA